MQLLDDLYSHLLLSILRSIFALAVDIVAPGFFLLACHFYPSLSHSVHLNQTKKKRSMAPPQFGVASEREGSITGFLSRQWRSR